ncbi:MAG: hypothetical protein JWP97_5380 [Labilithrix sp.]|nr:hypothetical protein [Labilithrix sp.]
MVGAETARALAAGELHTATKIVFGALLPLLAETEKAVERERERASDGEFDTASLRGPLEALRRAVVLLHDSINALDMAGDLGAPHAWGAI